MAAENAKTILRYEEVKVLKDNPSYILIDVREPSEVESGCIPGAVNIPLKEVENTLSNTSPGEFQEKYGREKPGKDFNIIFSCKAGGRSNMACVKAAALGYTNIFDYSGSWLDWEKNSKAS